MRTRLLAASILALLCVRAHAESNPTWLQVTTPHFTVITDASEKQARHVAGQFERMQAMFHRILPAAHSDVGSPIIVLAVKSRRDFQSLEPAAYLGKGQLNLAGLFLQNGESNYILVRLDTEDEHPFSTVYHEYTHYITRHANLPVWLNEGIAEFYQNSDIDAHEVRFGQPSHGDLQLLHQQTLIPLPTLFAVDNNSPFYHDEEKGSIFYAESWALTYMLYLNDFTKKTDLIPSYVKALASGQNPVAAAASTFGDLKKLQFALNNLISQNNFSYLKLPMEFPNEEASYKVTPLAEPDADAFRANVLVCDGRFDDGQKLIDAVLAADPNNALAHESEGILHFRQHDLAGARKGFTEATQLHSTSYLAWYYAAALSLQLGDHGNPAIEPDLRESLRLNPNFAPSNDTLATFYASERKNLDDALRLNLIAVSAEPDNLHFRLNNAFIHMQRKELPSALAVLETARPLAHNPAEIAELNSSIEQVHHIQEMTDRAARSPDTAGIMPGGGAVTTVVLDSQPPNEPGTTVTTVLLNNQPGNAPQTGPAAANTTADVPDNDPHYPAAAPTGPHHLARGILHDVRCVYPSILTVTLTGGPKPLKLYTNNMYKIDFVAGNFMPKGNLDPCKLDGAKVFVTWTAVTDPRVAGQIVSIQINK